MSRSSFSRLSLCAAAIGALAISAFVVVPSLAAEMRWLSRRPRRRPGRRRRPDRGARRRLLLGRAGRVPARQRRRQAVSGYAGGSKATAHYEIVGTGTTGHAESVQVTYDPAKVSYGKILQIFFSVAHDPTQLNRQGPDDGTQYRSAIFTTTDEQKKVADAYIAQLNAAKVFSQPIVTKVEPLTRRSIRPRATTRIT